MREHQPFIPDKVLFVDVNHGQHISAPPSAVDRERLLLRQIAQEEESRSLFLKGSLSGHDRLIMGEIACRGGCATLEQIGSGLQFKLAKRSVDFKAIEERLGHMAAVGGCMMETFPTGGCIWRLTEEAQKIAGQFLSPSNGVKR